MYFIYLQGYRQHDLHVVLANMAVPHAAGCHWLPGSQCYVSFYTLHAVLRPRPAQTELHVYRNINSETDLNITARSLILILNHFP